jgi:hypothetical protein
MLRCITKFFNVWPRNASRLQNDLCIIKYASTIAQNTAGTRIQPQGRPGRRYKAELHLILPWQKRFRGNVFWL